MIDLRSDTITQPTDAMRKAIAEAPVGDDVFHDDPSVLALEETVAELLGMDDAMYVPTGTMSNQTAIKTHTRPGDVILAAEEAHIHIHELGAPYVLSGVTIQFLETVDGRFTGDAVRAAIPVIPESMPANLFQPPTLVTVENTHNAAGAIPWQPEELRDVVAAAEETGLRSHMDGARLWNAAVATATTEADLVAGFDTVSVCFSKGLGAPMGSALVGKQEHIDTARRFKHMFGGGFRQAGMMAAGALYGVRNHRERLAEDHANAERLVAGLMETPGVAIDSASTNMAYFTVAGKGASEIVDQCHTNGVAMLPHTATSIRAVTNLSVTSADIDTVLGVIAKAAAG